MTLLQKAQALQEHTENDLTKTSLPLEMGSQNATMVQMGVLAASYITEPYVRYLVAYRMPNTTLQEQVQNWLTWHLQTAEQILEFPGSHTDLHAALVGFRSGIMEFIEGSSVPDYQGEKRSDIYLGRIDPLTKDSLDEWQRNGKYGRSDMAEFFWNGYRQIIHNFGHDMSIRNHILVGERNALNTSIARCLANYSEFDHYTLKSPIHLIGWYGRMLAAYQIAAVFRNVIFD